MPARYYLDFETYSKCDIDLGAYRYASDPSSRILLCGVAREDEPPVLWSSDPAVPGHPCDNARAILLLQEMVWDKNALIYAHNAQFEAAICKYLFHKTFGLAAPELDKWRCTASMCRRAAIPWSLAKAAAFLSLPAQKMVEGRSLIHLFSQPPGMPALWLTKEVTIDGVKMTVAQAWNAFAEYCLHDVEVERQIHKRMAPFEMKGMTLAGFQFDLRMNDRGIPVNLEALRSAKKLIENFNETNEAEFFTLSRLRPSQTRAVFEYLTTGGYKGDNLQSSTIEEYLEGPDAASLNPVCRRLLELKRLHSYAAVKKVPAMLAATCDDGRVRGAFMWAGAIRTHRWSGRLIQPQNFKRATFKDTHVAFDMVRRGEPVEAFAVMWGSPLEVLASSIRHFIADPKHMLIDADFSSIEARVAPWLAGQADMLNEFRAGEPLYETMASAIFGVPVKDVTGDQRFVGKTASLGCQFGMSWRKFQISCRNYGKELPDEICKLAVFRYRKKRDQIVRAWKSFHTAALLAVNEPGTVFYPSTSVGMIGFAYGKISGFEALTMTLPSGHLLVYPWPKVNTVEIEADIIEEDAKGALTTVRRKFKTEQITFQGPIPLKAGWGSIHTHGSKLFENAVQATAGDFMTHSLLEIEKAGFKPFATIHDQALCPLEEGSNVVTFERAFCKLPVWASDFPLEASVKVTPFYQKD